MIYIKFYTCKYDRTFKEVFYKDDNKDILIPVLETVLKKKITSLTFCNNEIINESIKNKKNTVDMLIDTSVGRIGVEVNARGSKYIKERNMAYQCRNYSNFNKEGDDYNIIYPVIQINFTYKRKKNLINKYMITNTKDLREKYVQSFVIFEIAMDNLYKNNYTKRELEKYKYLYMLNADLNKISSMITVDNVVSKFMEEEKIVNKNSEFIAYMTKEEAEERIRNTIKFRSEQKGIQKGEKQGLKEGIHKVEKKKTEQFVLSMLKDNMSLELISKYTELPISQILNLKKNIEN